MKLKVLYIAYWGLLEPLGQSLILPAVRQAAARGLLITLITFEKARDLDRISGVEALRSSLSDEGITWHPLRYHKTPTIPATLYDILQGVFIAARNRRMGRPDIIHGRTFIGGVIGAFLRFLFGAPFVYHNEGFWPDQQVEGGFWKKGSPIHRVCKRIENLLYGQADGLILLSHRSQPVVESLGKIQKSKTPIVIVPSCVDLRRFTSISVKENNNVVRLVYAGSLEGRYLVEPLGWFLQAMRQLDPTTKLEIYSQSDHLAIRNRLNTTGVPESLWNVSVVPSTHIPACLARATAGLHFLPEGIGTESGSPTKIGEYWASGIPVVTTPGAGDTDEVIGKYRVGVIIKELTSDGYRRAAGDLRHLLADSELSARCRKAAEEHYSLDKGVEAQIELYSRLLEKRTSGKLARESAI